jgi:hypothetical protein
VKTRTAKAYGYRRLLSRKSLLRQKTFSIIADKPMSENKIKIVEVNGRQCVRTGVAAERLNVSERRVLQFIEEGRLESIQLEEGGAHYIPLESLEELERVERPTGRPKKETAQLTAKKRAKKSAKK